MDKDNKNTELDNTDKKLHISGVINSNIDEDIFPPSKTSFILLIIVFFLVGICLRYYCL